MDHFIDINNETIPIEELLVLDTLNENNFIERCIENEIIRQESRRKKIMNSKEDMINGLEDFKRDNGIDNQEKFDLWLKNRHLTYETLLQIIDLCLLKEKLCNSISDSDLKEYYYENKNNFDKVCIHSFTIPDEQYAFMVYNLLDFGKISFRSSDIEKICNEGKKCIDEYIGWVVRKDFIFSEEEIIFDKKIQCDGIFGPFKSSRGYSIIRVLSKYNSDFEKDKNNIRNAYFNDYIFKLKLLANVKYKI